MGDSFVVFTATKDIPAFSNELLLDYRVRFHDDIAPGTHSRREEQGAEAAEQGAEAAEQGAEAALFRADDAKDVLFKASPSQDTLPVEDRSHVRLWDYARADAVMEPDMVTYIAALLRTPRTQREREREREIESRAHAQQGTGTENTAQSRHRTRIVFTHTSASLDNSHTHTYSMCNSLWAPQHRHIQYLSIDTTHRTVHAPHKQKTNK